VAIQTLETRTLLSFYIVDFGANPFADSTDSATHGGAGTEADPFHMSSLRGATIAANAVPGSTIILIAGTYQLTIAGDTNDRTWSGPTITDQFNPNIGDLDIYPAGITIKGAGAGLTTIQQTTGADRVITVNPNATPGATYTFTLSDLTMRGGRDASANHGGGGIFLGAKDNISTITNCIFVDNKVTSASGSLGGGAIQNTGGNLTVTNCVFGGLGANDPNTSTTSGGAIGYDSSDFVNPGGSGTLTVTNCTFINNVANSAAAGGGAIQVADSNLSSATANITGSTFIGNQAPSAAGGAIVVESGILNVTTSSFVNNHSLSTGGAIFGSGIGTNVHFSRFVGNTANTGKTLNAQTATFSATDNWWGQNTGPAAGDVTANVTATTWLQLRHVAALTNILEGTGSTTLTADILGRANSGGALAAAAASSLVGLPAFPSPAATIFNNAQVGSLTGASTQFVNGIATATFNAAATTGAGGADAKADNQTVKANITVSEITVSKVDVLQIDTDGDNLADPGETLRYTITLTNPSQQTATSVGFTDTPGANTSLVVGSATAPGGAITSGNTAGNTSVGVTYATLGPGASATITFDVLISAGDTARTVSNQGSATRSIFSILSDDPAAGGATDPTVTAVDMPDVKVELLSGASVTEDGTGGLVYTFTRQGPLSPGRTINFSVGGTAGLTGDFTLSGAGLTYTAGANTGTLAFADGSATATITVSPTDDTTVEADETVLLTVTAEGGSALGYDVGTPSAATGTILNDDTDVKVELLAASSVNEDGTTNLVYTFTRTGVTTNVLTVNFSATGTASAASDYGVTGTSTFDTGTGLGTVVFPANQTTVTVTIDPTADNTTESDETALLTVTAASGGNVYQVTGSPATGTITNDDSDVKVELLGASSVLEDGASNLVYTLTRTGFLGNALTVNLTVSGTASLTGDYAQDFATFNTANGAATVTFAANSSTATVTINPTVDGTPEADETVILTLAANGTIATTGGYSVGLPSAATGTILDDDNQNPVATDDNFTAAEDGPTVTGNLITGNNGNGVDSDADAGNVLSIASIDIPGLGTGLAVGVEHTFPSGATITVNGDGSFTFDPAAAYQNLDDAETTPETFTYTLSDGAGGSDTATVTVTISGVDDDPVATDNDVTTDQDTAISGNLITDNDGHGVDSDVDGDALTVASIGVDGNVLAVGVLHTLSTGATLIVNADGSYTYTPNGAFDNLDDGESGSDIFGYALSDGDGATSEGTVTVTITGLNDAPVAADDTFSVAEFSTVSGNLITGNNGNGPDSDVDVETLTITEVNGVAANVGTQITLLSGALLTVNADGTFTYDPNGAFDPPPGGSESDSFTYTLSDGAVVDQATVAITITGIGARGNIIAKFRPGRDNVILSNTDNLPLDVDIVFTLDGKVRFVGRNGTRINGLSVLEIPGIDTVTGRLGNSGDTVNVTGQADLFTLDLRGGNNAIKFEDFSSRRTVTATGRMGGLDFDAIDSQFYRLAINTGIFNDSVKLQNVDVFNTTSIRLSAGLHDVTIDDSTFGNTFILSSTGPNTTVAIEAGPPNAEETRFLGNATFIIGSSATLNISPLLTSDKTTFLKNVSILAKTPNAQLIDANAIYARPKKLRNVSDV
jgi:hypothetical protein